MGNKPSRKPSVFERIQQIFRRKGDLTRELSLAFQPASPAIVVPAAGIVFARNRWNGITNPGGALNIADCGPNRRLQTARRGCGTKIGV